MRSGVFDPHNLASLGPIADPLCFRDPVVIDQTSKDDLIRMLKMMLRIRFAEEAIAQLVLSGEARCPCHLGIGQEAIAVGVSELLRKTDRIFGGHRSHAHYLAIGGLLDQLFAEVLGKEMGCSKGMGGSMHLFGLDVGFVGSVPIVGATIPIAAGAALALKKDGGDGIAASYFGDGAAEEGIFHETLNLAATYKLPLLLICENNLYSSHLDIKLRQPNDVISRFAVAHQMKSFVVDGNDLLAVRDAATELILGIRRGEGPAFLEAVTYRWKGHVGPNEDIDVGVRRSSEDLAQWKHRDPIARFAEGLNAAGIFPERSHESIREDVSSEIQASVDRARTAPYPRENALLDTVYFAGSAS